MTVSPEAPALELREYQREAIDAIHEAQERGLKRVAIGLPTGCHARGTLVMRSDGRPVRVEDVKVGDLLMGPDSRPRRVLDLAHGRQAMRRIVPVKGDPWVCNLDHVLTLVRTNTHKDGRFPSQNREGETVDVTVREWEKWTNWWKHIYKLFRVPVRYPDIAEPELDPWFVGVLLGDGGLTRRDRVVVSKPEPELVAAMASTVAPYGLRIRSDGYEHHIVGSNRKNAVLGHLRDLGLSEITSRERHVPETYLYGSRSTRLRVLAGLIDTDGSLSNNGWDFLSVSEDLARDVARLARSVGLAAYVRYRFMKTNFAPDGVDAWRVSVNGDCDMVPCVVSRKAAGPRRQIKNVLRTGFSVEELPVDDYFGFSLDGDGRYLLDDFTVTHNTGKTIVFSQLIKEREHPALILAHTDELLKQAIDKYQMVDPTVPVGIVKAGLHQADLPVVVGSVQSVGRTARLERMPMDFQTIVIDEAHHAVAPTYRRIMDWYDHCPLTLGVSATLERSDKKALGKVFEEIVYSKGILECVEEGYLCDLRALSVKVKGFRLGQARKVHGDFVDSEIATMLSDAHGPAQAVKAYAEHAEGRKVVLFAPTVASAQEFAQTFVDYGVAATTISGYMPLEQRIERLEAFRRGEYMVMTNAMVLTEGFDEPAVDCIMIARPTASKGLYIQMIGRGTRLYPGKKDLLVIDLVGNDERHDVISVPTLLGLDPDKVKEGGVISAAQDKRRQPEIVARQLAGLADIGVEIESREAHLFDRKDVNWLRMADGSWVLSGKRGALILETSSDKKWRAVLYPNDVKRAPLMVADKVDLMLAMGMAEDKIVRKAKADTLRVIAKSEPWRRNPAGEKQIALLRDLRIPLRDGMTSGEASDLIAATFAQRNARKNKLSPVPIS